MKPRTPDPYKLAAAVTAGLLLILLLLAYTAPNADAARCGGKLHSADSHRWVLNLKGSTEIPKWAKQKHRRALKCAASPAHRKAMKNQWRAVQRSLLPANHDMWLRIGRCEQPGSGYGGVAWNTYGPTFQGGLGFYYATWSGYKPAGFPSNAGSATWRQQMKVANILYAQYGFTPWECYTLGMV